MSAWFRTSSIVEKPTWQSRPGVTRATGRTGARREWCSCGAAVRGRRRDVLAWRAEHRCPDRPPRDDTHVSAGARVETAGLLGGGVPGGAGLPAPAGALLPLVAGAQWAAARLVRLAVRSLGRG